MNEFQKDSGIIYPPFSQIYFEKYFYNYINTYYKNNNLLLDSYIPIFWTENQISTFDKIIQERRQAIVNTLKKTIKYFTIVQHDDGIIHTQLPNTIVFGMGGTGNIPLPLTYENTALFEKYKYNPKHIFCSFVGSLTHPCRIECCKQLHNRQGVIVQVNNWTNNISEINQKKFIEITSHSRFTLAPRGYGKTSFRMYEALNLKSIPVYIYDDPWLPYTEIIDWKKMAVLIHTSDISSLYETLQQITDSEISDMLEYYEQHKYLFTYDGMCEYIIQKVKQIVL